MGSHNSAIYQLVLPQIIEQWQQRQAENGEIVAVDALEQMNADAFELIAADARQSGVPRHVEIILEKAVRNIAHGQPRAVDATEQHGAVAHQRQRGMQLVRAPAQGSQPVSYTHLRAHETVLDLVCRLLLEKK